VRFDRRLDRHCPCRAEPFCNPLIQKVVERDLTLGILDLSVDTAARRCPLRSVWSPDEKNALSGAFN
jgi:hypothetical protein